MSGAGKTSAAKALSAILTQDNKPNLLLDGNHLRKIFDAKGYDKASRIALGIKYANLANALSDEKIVIIAANGMLKEVSAYCRANLKEYIEVFLDVPREILFKRDSAGLYTRYKMGEITSVGGLDLVLETPNADLNIKYDIRKTAQDIAQEIFTFLQKRQKGKRENKIPNPNAFLSTKANTLKYLQANIKSATVLPLWTITQGEFRDSKKLNKLLEILKRTKTKRFIVRSTSKNEDRLDVSNAGKYLSVLDVELNDITKAIGDVFASYGKAEGEFDAKDEVLIQTMAQNIAISGVAFNYEPKNFAPYFVIEYAQKSTNAVTSGELGVKKYIHAHSAKAPQNKHMAKVIALLKELESLIPHTPLDMEFGIAENGDIFLFQVRKLIIKATKKPSDSFILFIWEKWHFKRYE